MGGGEADLEAMAGAQVSGEKLPWASPDRQEWVQRREPFPLIMGLLMTGKYGMMVDLVIK